MHWLIFHSINSSRPINLISVSAMEVHIFPDGNVWVACNHVPTSHTLVDTQKHTHTGYTYAVSSCWQFVICYSDISSPWLEFVFASLLNKKKYQGRGEGELLLERIGSKRQRMMGWRWWFFIPLTFRFYYRICMVLFFYIPRLGFCWAGWMPTQHFFSGLIFTLDLNCNGEVDDLVI